MWRERDVRDLPRLCRPRLRRGSGATVAFDEEDDMLDYAGSERRPESQLSCQISVTAELDGLMVEVAGD